jgi:hypothetical protein
MADVSVEFGAKDVGLQDSLKKIQSEMQTLEGKVKSGELSFEELESTMKRLGQVERLEKQLQAIGNESAGAAPKVGELGKDIQDAGNKSEKMGEQSGMGFGKFVAGVGLGQIAAKAFTAVLDSAFAAVRGTIQGFTDALDLGGRLSDLSASTGETAGKLLVLERAFDNSGIGAEKVGSTIAKMQKNIEDARDGSGTAANAFAAMGVSVDELEGKLPTEQFKILSSGINSIDDPTQRAAAAMGVFGKSGAELLPLLTNLDGELGEARDTVGSMAEIMDRRNATFDAVGDRFKTIGEKVRDFAAGILDKALPAIDAITSALSRIDAAKIGQNLADAFLGGEKAMSGFQSAVNAFKTGQISAGLELLWESSKLQVQQTANSIVNYFTAAFNTVSDIIAMIFRSDGPTIGLIESSFTSLSSLISSKLYTALADFANSIGRLGMEEKFRYQAETAQKSYESAFGAISTRSELAAEDIGTNLAGAADLFSLHVESANKGLFDTSDQVKKIAELEKEVAAKVVETNAERAKSTEQLEKEKEERAKIKADAEAAAATERANAVALIEYETAINEAKAAGNEELVKSLESEKKRLEDQKEIAKLTAEYLPLVGNNAKEAERLATNMVNAKNAAASIGDTNAVVTITTTVDDTRWKDLLAEISANSNPKAIAVALEVTGKDNLNEAFATLQNMEQINKNYQAAFTAIGASSIEEVLANLEGIPTESQRQLAMQITGEEDFDRAVRKLDSVGLTKETKLLLQSQGFESMDAFQNQLDGIVGDKRTKLILETLNVKDAETAKDALTAILNNDGKKATITADADTTTAEQKIADLSTKTATVPLDADTAPLKTSLDKFTSNAQKLTLDASDAIKTIRAELAEPIKLDLSGATSSGGPGDNSPGGLTGLVNDIKTLLTTLSQKLPTPALA